eukprot:2706644-Prymnesium_polylepis.1
MADTAAAPAPRFALVTTIVNLTRHHYLNVTLQDMGAFHVCRLRGMYESLMHTGWTGDLICLSHGLQAGSPEVKQLGEACSRVLTPLPPPFAPGPGGKEAAAWARQRHLIPPPAGSQVATRADGRATAMKLH